MRRFRIKISTVLTFLAATVLGVSLFWVSQQVQQLEREQQELRARISGEKEGMRVLTAEWDYLNRPDRIERLAARYLDTMAPVTPENLLVDAKAVPEPQILQDEDVAPVPVSTGEVPPSDKNSPKPVSAEPSPRPIRDNDDAKAADFDAVLDKKADGEKADGEKE